MESTSKTKVKKKLTHVPHGWYLMILQIMQLITDQLPGTDSKGSAHLPLLHHTLHINHIPASDNRPISTSLNEIQVYTVHAGSGLQHPSRKPLRAICKLWRHLSPRHSTDTANFLLRGGSRNIRVASTAVRGEAQYDCTSSCAGHLIRPGHGWAFDWSREFCPGLGSDWLTVPGGFGRGTWAVA